MDSVSLMSNFKCEDANNIIITILSLLSAFSPSQIQKCTTISHSTLINLCIYVLFVICVELVQT